MEDIVDEFYLPLVRPLGNLVIVFAQAEWSLVEFLAECNGNGEELALQILKKPDARQIALQQVSKSELGGFDLKEALDHIAEFWSNKEKRNRYIHDEWFPNILVSGGVAATRGRLRKRGSETVWDEPTPEDVWALALRFREHRGVFSVGAYKVRRQLTDKGA